LRGLLAVLAVALGASTWTETAADVVANVDRGPPDQCVHVAPPPVTATFTVGHDGHVRGPVDTGGRADVLARRAVKSILKAEPYAQTYRGLRITVRFTDRNTCAERK
jgi:hypothetical protein